MARTPTLPPDEPRMWRRLVARTHPDAGGIPLPHRFLMYREEA